MKRLLLAIALVLVMAIPVFAQNGPIKIKPLMVFTENASGSITPYFYDGEFIYSRIDYVVKGTGSFRVRFEVRNSAGVLIDKNKSLDIDVDNPTFAPSQSYFQLTPGAIRVAGYYTLKTFYVDLATRTTWSHQTKFYVSEPD
jgi:hypothetical protein